MRFPNRRPCMSVNAVTTVSIAPDSPSFLRSSRDSMPRVPPGPPGRSALMGYLPPTTASALIRELPAGARRGSTNRLLLDDAHALVELDLPDRALVALVHAERPGEAGPQQDDRHDQGRVVEEAPVEVRLPRHPKVGEGQHENDEHQ